MTTTTTTTAYTSLLPTINPLLVTETTFTLSEFSVTRIAIFSLCLLVGLSILFNSTHSRPIMFGGGLVIGAILTGISMYNITYDKGLSSMMLMTVGSSFVAFMVSISGIYFLPFSAPATGLAFVFLCWCTSFECIISIQLNPWYGSAPIAAGILLGIGMRFRSTTPILLGMYMLAGVPLFRGVFFYWPRSQLLHWYHKLVTCSIGSFLLVTGTMYFVHPNHVNLMSLARTAMARTSCDSQAALISLLSWLGVFALLVFRHTDTWDTMWSKLLHICSRSEPESVPKRRRSVRKSVLYFEDDILA